MMELVLPKSHPVLSLSVSVAPRRSPTAWRPPSESHLVLRVDRFTDTPCFYTPLLGLLPEDLGTFTPHPVLLWRQGLFVGLVGLEIRVHMLLPPECCWN